MGLTILYSLFTLWRISTETFFNIMLSCSKIEEGSSQDQDANPTPSVYTPQHSAWRWIQKLSCTAVLPYYLAEAVHAAWHFSMFRKNKNVASIQATTLILRNSTLYSVSRVSMILNLLKKYHQRPGFLVQRLIYSNYCRVFSLPLAHT